MFCVPRGEQYKAFWDGSVVAGGFNVGTKRAVEWLKCQSMREQRKVKTMTVIHKNLIKVVFCVTLTGVPVNGGESICFGSRRNP